ncbi:MAG: hypothetical protein ACOVP4_09565 [Bacteriovoracaceae bacterium]
MKLLLFSFLMVTSLSAFAQIDINELCSKAGIASLKHLDLNNWDGPNICEKPMSELTAGEKRNLEEINNIHQKVAALFGISAFDLFVEPLEIDLLESTLGGLYSYAGVKSISIGVYPNSDYVFNNGIYSHELGHILSGSKNKNLPVSFADLDNSILFIEMFADLISLSLFDEIIIPVSGEESCIDRARYISSGQTYHMAQEYFLSDFSMARLAQCCKSRTMENRGSPIKGFCEEFSRMGEFPVKLTTPFDPMTIEMNKVDDHQIGIPLLSFMKELSRKTQLQMKDIFKLGFDHKTPRTEVYSCEVNLEIKKIELHTVRSFLQDLRGALTYANQLTYDLLATKHGIEKGLQFGDRHLLESLSKKENLVCHKII